MFKWICMVPLCSGLRVSCLQINLKDSSSFSLVIRLFGIYKLKCTIAFVFIFCEKKTYIFGEKILLKYSNASSYFTSVKCSKKPIASQTSPCDMFTQGSGIKSSTAQAMKGQMKFLIEITKSFAKPTLKSRYVPPPGGPPVLFSRLFGRQVLWSHQWFTNRNRTLFTNNYL